MDHSSDGGGGDYVEDGVVDAKGPIAISKRDAAIAACVLAEKSASKPPGATSPWWRYFFACPKASLYGIAMCKISVANGNTTRADIKHGSSPHLQLLDTKTRGTGRFTGSQKTKIHDGSAEGGKRRRIFQRYMLGVTLLVSSRSKGTVAGGVFYLFAMGLNYLE